MGRKERKNRRGRGEEKEWEDDDGRIIADMSQIGDPGISGLFLFRRSPENDVRPGDHSGISRSTGTREAYGEEQREDRPWEQPFQMTKKERFYYALGATKAALLIGLVYLAGLGLVIFLLSLLWS